MVENDIWKTARAAVLAGQKAVLIVIVRSEGSVPGKRGAKMVVTDTDSAGTVGGGTVEQELRRSALAVRSSLITVVEHNSAASSSVCSGEQTVAIYPFRSTDADSLSRIVETLDAHRFGALSITDDLLAFQPDASCETVFHASDDTWAFHETIGFERILTIIGGGHVSLSLSRVMATLPFKLRVLDDREDIVTMTGNRYAHERLVITYDSLLPLVPTGDRSFVTIMTHHHEGDEAVLRQLAPFSFGYLGMLGSRTKVSGMFERLASTGISAADLAKVHAPIGLPIGSKTPSEIALSIAAEIVQTANRKGL